jgi:hypothetical protein
MTKERVFEQYRKLIDDMHNHVYEKGFSLEHCDIAGRVGFKCTTTDTVWHMNAQVWADSVPELVLESYETQKGRDLFLNSLKGLFAQPHQQSKKTCKAHGCVRGPKKDKKEFCGWCFKKFERKELTEDGVKIRTWLELKEDISPRLDVVKLKAFGVAHPKYTETFGCGRLNIFVDPVVCMGRLFIHDRKQCKKCDVHRDKIEDLENFLDSCNIE